MITARSTVLNRDVIALLETVSNEQTTIANKEWKSHPESLVRDHLRDSLSTLDLPVDDHTNSDVGDDCDKKKTKNNNAKSFTTTGTCTLTTTSLAADGNFHNATIVGNSNFSNNFIVTTDNVNLGRSTNTVGAVFTVFISNSNTLTRLYTIKLDGDNMLSLKITIANSGPKTGTTANRRRRITRGGGITADVDVGKFTILTHEIEAIRELRWVVKRS